MKSACLTLATLLFVTQAQAFFMEASVEQLLPITSAEKCFGLWSLGPEPEEFEAELQALADVRCQTKIAVRASEIEVSTRYTSGPTACSVATAQYNCVSW